MSLLTLSFGSLLWCGLAMIVGVLATHALSQRRLARKCGALLAANAQVEQTLQRERLSTQHKLAEASQRWRAFVDALPDAVLWLDEAACVQHANPAAQRLFGIGEEPAQGLRVDQLKFAGVDASAAASASAGANPSEHPGALPASCLVRVQRALTDPWPLNDIESLRTVGRDGQPLELEWWPWRTRLLDQPHVLAMFRDVSLVHQQREQKESLERELRLLRHEHGLQLAQQSALARTAARVKDEFLANMSHELRTPMNTVIGLAHRARACAQGEQAQRLDRLTDAAGQLMALLNDILEFARMDSGASALQLRETGIAALVHQVTQLLVEPAALKGLQLVPWIDSATPTLVLADEMRLRRVLLNLASNAIKFTERGHVTLRVRCLSVDAQRCRLHLEVHDTGIGMSPQIIQRLGLAFEQADASSTRSFGGTGLGVAICQRVLHSMGSALQVNSQPGRGSGFAFTLELPVVRDISPPLASKAAGQGQHVLVVDSLDDSRAALTEQLMALGCRVQAVANVDEALLAIGHAESLQTSGAAGFDVCVLDSLSLAQTLDSAVRRIAATARKLPPQLLLLTPADQLPETGSGALTGVQAHCAKPASPEQLAQALQRCQRRSPDPAPTVLETGEAASTPEAAAAVPVIPPELAHLKHIQGLDLLVGLRRLRGSANHLERLLERFAHSHQADAELLKDCASRGDLQQAYALAHQLRGTAGTIGAQHVAHLAARIADPTQSTQLAQVAPAAQAMAMADVVSLADALNALLRDLKAAADATTDTPAASKAEAEADTSLEVLRALLERRDMSARRHVQQHGSALRRMLGHQVEPLMHAVQTFDFDAALNLLDDRSHRAAQGSRFSAVGQT